MGLRHYLVRRILYMIPTFFGVTILTFSLMYAAGNPVNLMLGGVGYVTDEVIQNAIRQYNLDKPIYIQYLTWLENLMHFDMGTSFYGGTPVTVMISRWLWETLKLQFAAIAIAVGLALVLGTASAHKQYSKVDTSVTIFGLFGNSMPVFWLGLMLIIVFSYYLNWFPSFGAHSTQITGSYILDELWHMALPTAVLVFYYLPVFVRLVRASMMEILRMDYILAAKASGLSSLTVSKHALRNALIPVVTYLGVALGMAIGGAPVTESVFTWPGLGYLYVTSIDKLDFPVIMGINVTLAISVLFASLFTDIIYGLIDPRIVYD